MFATQGRGDITFVWANWSGRPSCAYVVPTALYVMFSLVTVPLISQISSLYPMCLLINSTALNWRSKKKSKHFQTALRWENGDYSDILVNKAQAMNGFETPSWWIITASAMTLIFLLPQVSRLIIRRIPEYADNLCNILLLTVERSSALEGLSNKAKNVGILLVTDDNEADRTTLLAVNGHPVNDTEKSINLKRRYSDERPIGIDESYKHPDGSVPTLK